jgi:hypothetical protein
MLKYVPEALVRFQHKAPQTPQHLPYPHIKPTYGSATKYAEEIDMAKRKKHTSKRSLKHSSTTHNVLTHQCSQHSVHQPNPMKNTFEDGQAAIDYTATHPDTIVTIQNRGISCTQ